MNAACPDSLAIDTSAQAVRGFTTKEAPCSKETSLLRGITPLASAAIYSAQVPFPSSGAWQATRLPTSQRPNIPALDDTTVPDPSKPGTTGGTFLTPY